MTFGGGGLTLEKPDRAVTRFWPVGRWLEISEPCAEGKPPAREKKSHVVGINPRGADHVAR